MSLPMKIGADPEFTFSIGKLNLHASEVIHGLFSRPSRERMGQVIPESGIIGWDGCNSTAEIRPLPSNNPKTVVNNIRKLFEAATKRNSILSLRTLNMDTPIGGHIHFDTSILSKETAMHGSKEMNKLHYHMALYSLPVLLGENQKHFVARHKHNNYGRFNDYRQKTIGNSETYEFRLPSAEWITTPKIAQSTLAYLGVVFAEIAKDPKKFYKKNKDIAIANEEQAQAIEGLFMANYYDLIKKHIFTIKKRIKSFEHYEEYKNEINYILNPKRVLKDKEKAEYDAAIGWGLRGIKTKKSKRTFLVPFTKIEEKFIRSQKASQTSDDVNDNGDENTGYFAMTLQIAKLKNNEKFKNRYYIYGLRSGIPNPIVYKNNGKFLAGNEMIKTIKDAYGISSIISQMTSNAKRVQPKEPKNTILIGLPLLERKTLNTKNFLELVWKTEHNLLKESEINIATLVDDTAPNATLGELAAVFTKETPKT